MTTIRTCRSTFFIFGGFGLFFILLGLAVLVKRGNAQALLMGVLMAAFFVGPFLRYRISWDDEVLTYRSVFTTRTIRFSDIKSHKVHGPLPGDRQGPTVGLSLFVKGQKAPAFTINIKPFSLEDLALLDAQLNEG